MIYDYDNPNTCYAIGDSFGVVMGTAAENRQPASGVFEEVSSVARAGTTDETLLYDGTNNIRILFANVDPGARQGDASAMRMQVYNMAIKIGNAVYLRKPGTTDRMAASGVQVDA